MIKKILVSALIIGIIGLISAGIIIFGKGYRLNPKNGKLQTTGLLLAKSYPDGAQVYVDNHLVSATNNTITLPPGIYEVRIEKDGYLPWKKKLQVKGEIVTRADALLLPVAPDLRPLTTTGALNPTLSLDGTKIAYGIATASAEKQGVWINDLSDRPMTFQPAARQIIKDNIYLKYSQGHFIWSPDTKQLIIELENNFYLVSTDGLNENPQDISLTSDLLLTQWIDEYNLKQEALVKSLKPTLTSFLQQNSHILAWSPDETKILYEATNSANLEHIINPPLIGTNTQPEERNITSGKIYVYDIKEDKNFYLRDKEPTVSLNDDTSLLDKYKALTKRYNLQWLSDSSHLIWMEKDDKNQNKISIVEYDNTNKETVLSTPLEDNFIFPFPNSISIIVLTTLNPQISTPNLYVINLR